jgi:hypothetical protein
MQTRAPSRYASSQRTKVAITLLEVSLTSLSLSVCVCVFASFETIQPGDTVASWSSATAASRLYGFKLRPKDVSKYVSGAGRAVDLKCFTACVESLVLVDYPKRRRSACVDGYLEVSPSSSSSYGQRFYHQEGCGRGYPIAEACVAAVVMIAVDLPI